MMVPNFSYSHSYVFLNITIIIIIIFIINIIFLLLTYISLGGNATEPTIFQHLQAKFDEHTFLYTWLSDRK